MDAITQAMDNVLPGFSDLDLRVQMITLRAMSNLKSIHEALENSNEVMDLCPRSIAKNGSDLEFKFKKPFISEENRVKLSQPGVKSSLKQLLDDDSDTMTMLLTAHAQSI